MDTGLRIRELINRLARLDTAQAWQGDLNPTQSAVLEYLHRANRFSRGPSHVADYLGTTRGTISQSLKSLARKGYVTERRSQTDRRAISFDLTAKGTEAARARNVLADAVGAMEENARHRLLASLEAVIVPVLRANGGKPFGICRECRHFSARDGGGYCMLLSEDLTRPETGQICHEQSPA